MHVFMKRLLIGLNPFQAAKAVRLQLTLDGIFSHELNPFQAAKAVRPDGTGGVGGFGR